MSLTETIHGEPGTELWEDFFWRIADGTDLPARRWIPDQAPRALVLCVHGMGGAPSDFNSFGNFFCNQRILSVALTVRGQGLDPNPFRRGHEMGVDEVRKDFLSLFLDVRSRWPDKPIFLCGESLGALLAAAWLAGGHFKEIAGCIFSAPVVALARETPPIVRWALGVLATAYPKGKLRSSWFVTGGSKPPSTSRDQLWLDAQRSAAHHIPVFSFKALDATGKLIRKMNSLAPNVTVPALVLTAGRDVFVRPDSIRAWFDLLGSKDKTLLEYPEAYHVLWNDLDRANVLSDIANWFLPRLQVS